MVKDLVHNLCESLVENIDGVAGVGKKTPPIPIVYLTQWKIVGNSEVHTLPYPDGVVLPTGYKRCKYLQSDGAAYIELSFGFNKTDEMYAKVKFNAIYNDERHIISLKHWGTDKDASSRFCFAKYVVGSYSRFGVALGNISAPSSVFTPVAPFNLSVCEVSYRNKLFTLLNEGNTFVCDLSNAVFGKETSHICLLKNHDNTGTPGAIYEYRHKKGNTEYRLIPCLDSNDTPCMYDVINNQAYYNSANSGYFTYELYPQPTEIWSCGEYNATDGKYHILVQPQGGSIADIALDAPLRKVNDVADTIEFPSGTEGKALVTRYFDICYLGDITYSESNTEKSTSDGLYRFVSTGLANVINRPINNDTVANILSSRYTTITSGNTYLTIVGIAINRIGYLYIYDSVYHSTGDATNLKNSLQDVELIYELATPTTELVDAPQIQEAESYSMVISQGGKAVSWSSFETE